MTTNAGMNWIALLVLVYEGVSTIPDGTIKHVLIGMTLTAISVVAYATKGSGLTPRQTDEILDTTADIQEVLKQGRK